MNTPLTAKQFTPTQWDTAEAKAVFGNRLIRFVDQGFPQHLFTKKFYNRLSMTFGHTAHYNRTGFWAVWFSTANAQRDFVRSLLDWPGYGDPAWTYSDVEKAVAREIKAGGYLAVYTQRAAEQEEARERATLERLQIKYPNTTPREGVTIANH